MSKNTQNTESNEALAEAQAGTLVTMDFAADAGTDSGMEDMTSEDVTLPFLRVLQQLSPQLNPSKPEYMKEAQAGMFYNSATNELLGTEIQVIPCVYQRLFLEWEPRKMGGGFVGEVSMADAAALDKGEKGFLVNEAGNEIYDTRHHYLLVYTEKGLQPVLMPLKSTQIKQSKKWNHIAKTIKIDGAQGPFTPPMYSQVYNLHTVTEQKDSDTWSGIRIKHLGSVQTPEAYAEAKEFRNAILAGVIDVQHANEKEDTVGGAEASSNVVNGETTEEERF